jgi:hypothetical protein
LKTQSLPPDTVPSKVGSGEWSSELPLSGRRLGDPEAGSDRPSFPGGHVPQVL